MSTNAQITATNEEQNKALNSLGLSKTIYAWVMPETARVWNDFLDKERAYINSLYVEAWSGKHTGLAKQFANKWLEWTNSVVDFKEADFPFFYPTAGSSEGLRQSIFDYAITPNANKPRIHIFNGEYEGYGAYAKAANVECVVHDRKSWREAIAQIKSGEQFYISQPSALDGMIWDEFDDFAKALKAQNPDAKIMLDLTYVGGVARDYKIDATHENIERVFFSLSKPMGVYYHRIGGCWSKKEDLGLFGNMWFRNSLEIAYGIRLMDQYGVQELPRRYQALQHKAAAKVSHNLDVDLVPADVFILATSNRHKEMSDLEKYLIRGTTPESKPRYCLSPLMDALEKVESSLKARNERRQERPRRFKPGAPG